MASCSLAVGAFHFSQADHLAHDLGVEAGALGLGIDLADVVGQRLLFFFKALDALDEGTQMLFGEAALCHFQLHCMSWPAKAGHPGDA